MKHAIKVGLFLLFATVGAGALANPAQCAPTAEETELWLQAHLPAVASAGASPGFSANSGSSTTVTASYVVSDCKLMMTTRTTFNSYSAAGTKLYELRFRPTTDRFFNVTTVQKSTDPEHLSLTERSTINFRDFSLNGVQFESSPANGPLFDAVGPLSIGPQLVVLTFDDQTTAQRVKKAMIYEIESCGGRPERSRQ